MTSVTALPGPPQHRVPATAFDLGHRTNDSIAPTQSSSSIPRGPVDVTLNFYKAPEDGAIPFNYVEAPPQGQPQRNFSDHEDVVSLQDARGQEDSFDLDRHAFATLQDYPHNPMINWDDDNSVKEHYFPQVEKLLLDRIPGSPSRVLLFDHTIRRAKPNAHRAPVTRAHIDQTAKSAKMRVDFHLPKEAKELLANGTRYRIVNVWRPINGPVESTPLAFANSETVADDDMVGIEHRYPDRTGETASVRYSPAHKWYYWSGMTESDRLLLQCFDSKLPNNRVPHSAFVDPRSTESSKPRESIEVRALILG